MPVAAPEITNTHSPASAPSPQRLNHLRLLEAESIHILREVASEFERPVMLYSIGKDSSVMLRLAQKAFYPGPIPFPLMHIDTGFKFREMLSVSRRDGALDRRGVAGVAQRAGDRGGNQSHCARHQTLLRAAEDAGAAGWAAPLQLRCGLWRRAARRGKIARQGAHLFLPRHGGAVGPEEPAAGAVEPVQRAHSSRRKHSRVSALELDGDGCVAVHPRGKHSRGRSVLCQRAAHVCAWRRAACPSSRLL